MFQEDLMRGTLLLYLYLSVLFYYYVIVQNLNIVGRPRETAQISKNASAVALQISRRPTAHVFKVSPHFVSFNPFSATGNFRHQITVNLHIMGLKS